MKFTLHLIIILVHTCAISRSKLACQKRRPVIPRETICGHYYVSDLVQEEVSAAMTYLAMGAHFLQDTVNLQGFARTYFEFADEKRGNAKEVLEYLLQRRELKEEVELKKLIETPSSKTAEWRNGLEAMKEALAMESAVTSKIQRILEECGKPSEKEFSDQHVVHNLGVKLLNEQHKRQQQLNEYISDLSKNSEFGGLEFIFDKCLNKERTNPVGPMKTGNVVDNIGYSKDSQHEAPQSCYKATISSTSDEQSFLQLDTSVTFSELQKVFGISVNASGTYKLFSANATVNYLRAVRETDHSISLNYYQYFRNKAAVKLGGFGESLLTETGEMFYQGGKNKYFGVTCGDYYAYSFWQGTMFSMGVKIEFNSSMKKNQFTADIGLSFGSIIGAVGHVEKGMSKEKMNGTVTLHAYQIGGDPKQLGKVLGKNKEGHYYVLACNSSAMENCIKTAESLLDYAEKKFPKQFSFSNGDGLTSLGDSFSNYDPIRYVGLQAPPSLVTKEVTKCRAELSYKLLESQYYQDKLNSIVNGYPISLTSGLMKKLKSVLAKAKSNIDVLMEPRDGAAGCFNYPDECEQIKANIDSQIKDITADDLTALDKIKYVYTAYCYACQKHHGRDVSNFFNNGNGGWVLVPHDSKYLITSSSMTVVENEYKYEITYKLSKYEYKVRFLGMDYDVDGPSKIKGILTLEHEKKYENREENKNLSPFFFDSYSEFIESSQ